jgi:hypothetical protein
VASCTVKTKSECPNEFTPDDEACAWRYCQSHDDPRCGDASTALDGSISSLDGSVDSALDGSWDAGDSGVLEDAGCRSGLDCPGPAPYCLASGACVSCTEDGQCPAGTPSCVAGSCTRCTGSSACARYAESSVCDGESGGCVTCTSAEPAACMSAGAVCKSGGTTCVACNTNAECTSASASRCEGNACTACEADMDCTQVSGKPVCNGGTCVACTPSTEASRCGETACDPDTLTCTSTKRGSLATCVACRADSECLAGRKCVQVPFMGADSGFFCMQELSGGCVNPYRIQLSATSKSGVGSAQYCAHNTDVTSCKGIVSLTSDKSCTGATEQADCGPGARCETVGGIANRCTYACSSDAVCPVDFACNEQSSASPYCGGPSP